MNLLIRISLLQIFFLSFLNCSKEIEKVFKSNALDFSRSTLSCTLTITSSGLIADEKGLGMKNQLKASLHEDNLNFVFNFSGKASTVTYQGIEQEITLMGFSSIDGEKQYVFIENLDEDSKLRKLSRFQIYKFTESGKFIWIKNTYGLGEIDIVAYGLGNCQ